jgi:hypothetical protein
MLSFVFRWVAIPWLQAEADTYLYNHNTTMRRKNKNKVLPHGIPDIMFDKPRTVGAVDFRVRISHLPPPPPALRSPDIGPQQRYRCSRDEMGPRR